MPEEKKALRELANVLRKHEELPKLFANLDAKTTWRQLEAALNRAECNALRAACVKFSARFESLWCASEPGLINAQRTLLHSLASSWPLIRQLGTLYGTSGISDEVEIFLLTCPITKRAVSGGSSLGKSKMEIECSTITKHNDKKSQAARVVLHELIHTAFEKVVKIKIEKFLKTREFTKDYRRALRQSAIYRQTKSYGGVVKEMIAVSLLPEGYLAEKFFGLNVIKNLTERRVVQEKKLQKTYYDLMLFAVGTLYKTAKTYTEHKQPIDSGFIREALRTWRTFEEIDLSKHKFKQKARNR